MKQLKKLKTLRQIIESNYINLGISFEEAKNKLNDENRCDIVIHNIFNKKITKTNLEICFRSDVFKHIAHNMFNFRPNESHFKKFMTASLNYANAYNNNFNGTKKVLCLMVPVHSPFDYVEKSISDTECFLVDNMVRCWIDSPRMKGFKNYEGWYGTLRRLYENGANISNIVQVIKNREDLIKMYPDWEKEDRQKIMSKTVNITIAV